MLTDDRIDVRVIVGDGDRFNGKIDLVIIPELKADIGRRFNPRLKEKIYDSLIHATKGLDLIIVHNMMTMPFNLEATAAIAEISRVIPTITWVHDLAWFDPAYPFPNKEFPWSLLINRNPDMKYVVISELRKRQLTKLFGATEDTPVIPNGVDIFEITNCDTELARILEPKIDKGAIALTPGRLVRRKNFELAISIVAEINKKMAFSLIITAPVDPHNPDTRDYYQDLKVLVNRLQLDDRVVFLSEMADLTRWDRIRSLYLLSDILLLTSKIEGFGLPVMEAAILKTPVCVSAIPPVMNIVGDSGVITFDYHDQPSDIARLIVDRLQSSDDFRLRRRVIEEFSWRRIYQNKIKPVLNAVITARR